MIYAEITRSTLASCSAECWDHTTIPPFGLLVKCQAQSTIYLFVSNITTQPRNGAPQPRAYRKTPTELQTEYPHIFYYLTTTLELVPTCWQSENKINFQLPPRPIPLHSFIEPVSPDLYSAVMQSKGWLPALFSLAHGQPLFDELLLAVLHQALEHHALNRAHLEQLSRSFAELTGNNYQRIRTFLQRVELLI